MLVVVVLPLVPVIKITLYPLATVDNILLSKAKATLPGKLEPPLNNLVLNFNIIFEVIIAINEFILIFHTSFKHFSKLF
jgi:hypothetical protein